MANETILEEANRLIYGARQETYGHPLDDFGRTAGMWTSIMRDLLKPGAVIPPEMVGLCMICVKISRQINHPKRDNMVDAAGYAGTVQMVVEEKERRNEHRGSVA